MEDLKKIQEFFSKPLEEMMSLDDQAKAYYLAKVKSGEIDTLPEDPKAAFLVQMTKDQMAHDKETLRRERGLEEGKQLDIEDFAKVVQAVTQTGHPVTVLYIHKFNEIEILTGMNAPDDMLRDLSNAVDSLGYGRDNIIIAADSSNLSRREYNDIRRVNGGHKDYFEEATKDEETEFHSKLDKLVHDTFGKRKGELEESSSSEERRIAKRAIRSIAKYRGVSEKEARNDLIRAVKELGDLKEEEGYSKFLKDDPEHPGGKTKGLTPDVMNKILMNVIKDLDELKQLGEGIITEELCDKGKRYIKARQAAGEKSSAYLSGRAVRVCKDQIEWPKKGKKNESLNEAANVEDEMFAAMKNLAISLEKANDNVKPSPKDKKVEEGVITLGATIIGAPGLMTVLGKGANYLGKVFGKDKNAVGEFLKKKGHQLEEFYIESLGGWIKAAFPNKYEGQDIKDKKSELHQAAQKAYAAMLTVAAIGAGYEAGVAASVVKAGVEGGMAVLKSSEVIDIIRKLA